jgi:hypothetical protein
VINQQNNIQVFDLFGRMISLLVSFHDVQAELDIKTPPECLYTIHDLVIDNFLCCTEALRLVQSRIKSSWPVTLGCLFLLLISHAKIINGESLLKKSG